MSHDSFFYVVDGQARPLRRVESVRFVSPARDHHMAHVGARLARSTRLSIDTGVAHDCLVVRGDPHKLEEVCTYSDVKATRSAFLDSSGHELILTDDVLVRFSSSYDDEARHDLCKKLDCRVVTAKGNTWRVRILDPQDEAPLHIANKFVEEKSVEFAEPNAVARARYAAVQPPADDLFANQWHLHNDGHDGGVAGADVRALDAWEISFGSPNVRVVVHDSGVDIDHPDLAANMEPGNDFDNNDDDASNNFGPHGTACAGVIAAAMNGEGVVGIAPQCRITPLRAAGAHPFEVWAETFEWAAEHGEIISCSWGITPSNILTQAIRDAATNGRDGRGIPIFCATGNDAPLPVEYPANLPETIGVGASTNLDRRAGYSQFGTGVDFVAPSSGGTLRIETTDVAGAFGYNSASAGEYCNADDATGFGGTSSATPLAAGVGALLLSVNPELTAEEVREIMRETADKIEQANADYDQNGWSQQYGYGRINADEAVREAQRRANSGDGDK